MRTSSPANAPRDRDPQSIEENALSTHFTAELQKSPNRGGWTYVVMPGSGE